MLELMGICIELDDAPLATYPQGSQWKVWTEKQATATLQAVIERRGLDPREYALHSGRIGGASRLAAMGLSTYDIQRQGRWKSQAVGMYYACPSSSFRCSRKRPSLLSLACASGRLSFRCWTTDCVYVLSAISFHVRTYADASFHIAIQARSTNTRFTYVQSSTFCGRQVNF